MFVPDGNPILGSMVLAYKTWTQCPSAISHGYIVKTELSPEGIYLSYSQNIFISHRGYCNLCSQNLCLVPEGIYNPQSVHPLDRYGCTSPQSKLCGSLRDFQQPSNQNLCGRPEGFDSPVVRTSVLVPGDFTSSVVRASLLVSGIFTSPIVKAFLVVPKIVPALLSQYWWQFRGFYQPCNQNIIVSPSFFKLALQSEPQCQSQGFLLPLQSELQCYSPQFLLILQSEHRYLFMSVVPALQLEPRCQSLGFLPAMQSEHLC